MSPPPTQQNPDPRFYQQVGEKSKKLSRFKLAEALNSQYDDLSERVALFRSMAPPAHPQDPVLPGQERPGEEPKQNRPEINAIPPHLRPRDYNDRSSADHRSGWQIARDQAQHLIDNNMTPQSYAEWREQHMHANPGPGIAAPAQDPMVIRW